MRKPLTVLLVAAALTFQFAATQALAVGLSTAGPVNSSAPGAPFPANGLPSYYQDSNGLALQGCLDNTPLGTITPMCILPIILEEDYDFHLPIAYNGGLPGIDPITQLGPPPGPTVGKNGGIVNYPSETFYFYASSNPKVPLTIGTGSIPLVLMALEGSYVVKDSRLLQQSPPLAPTSKSIGNPRPVDQEQGVFQRFKVLMDNTPVAGNYTLTHPWGKIVFNCPTVGALCKSITDIPLGTPLNFLANPDPALGQATVGSIGPFMVSANPLPPATPAPFTTMPNGNIFIGNPTAVGTKGVVPNCPTCNKDANGFAIIRIDGPPGSLLTTGDVTEFFIGGQVLGMQLAGPAAGNDFGIWKLAATATPAKTFTLTNSTGTTATITVSSNNPAFTIPAATDHCTTNAAAVPPVPALPAIPPNNTCTFDVAFTPTVNGAANGTISVSAPGLPTATTNVTGTGDSLAPTLAIGQISRATNLTSQTISGTVSDNTTVSSVTVSVNGAAPTAATVSGGTWSASLSGLTANASNTLAVVATDAAQPAPGNQTTVNDSIVVDTIAPTVTIDPVTSPTRNTSQALTGTANDANGISSVSVSANGTLQGLATVTGTTWSFNLTGLNANATNAIAVNATDPAGNTSANATATIKVDTVVSPFTLNTLATPTRLNSQILSGTIEPGSSVQVALNGAAPLNATVNGGIWNLTLNGLVEGANSIALTATDALGNTAALSGSITLDTQVTPFTIGTVPSSTRLAVLPLSGTIEAGASVEVALNGGTPAPAKVTGTTWSFGLGSMSAGSNSIVVSATDAIGNTASLPAISLTFIPTDGDVNLDGKVDLADALLALRIAVGLVTPTNLQLQHGDVAPFTNGLPTPDGVMDIADAMAILRKVLGLVHF